MSTLHNPSQNTYVTSCNLGCKNTIEYKMFQRLFTKQLYEENHYDKGYFYIVCPFCKINIQVS